MDIKKIATITALSVVAVISAIIVINIVAALFTTNGALNGVWMVSLVTVLLVLGVMSLDKAPNEDSSHAPN